MKISRQAVNQTKNRGLNKMRQVISFMDRGDNIGKQNF